MKRRILVLLYISMTAIAIEAAAQIPQVQPGQDYTIESVSGASTGNTFRWFEQGPGEQRALLISGAEAATYTIKAGKAPGIYTYVRQAYSAECDVWQNSNAFKVQIIEPLYAETGTRLKPGESCRPGSIIINGNLCWNPNYWYYESTEGIWNQNGFGNLSVGCPKNEDVVRARTSVPCAVGGIFFYDAYHVDGTCVVTCFDDNFNVLTEDLTFDLIKE